MPTPLLAFLNDVEDALRNEATARGEEAWATSRMVNYQHGLARMMLAPAVPLDSRQKRGAIFLQSIPLADGTLTFKVNLTWHGSDAFPTITFHSKPRTTWKNEAAGIATAWLSGPPESVVSSREIAQLVAAAME